MTFEQLELIEPIRKALKKEKYTTPTPIQAEAIPVVLDGSDLLGCAQTGTGKTAAFSIPIIQKIEERISRGRKPGIKALILTPTRELAIQIGESFTHFWHSKHDIPDTVRLTFADRSYLPHSSLPEMLTSSHCFPGKRESHF